MSTRKKRSDAGVRRKPAPTDREAMVTTFRAMSALEMHRYLGVFEEITLNRVGYEAEYYTKIEQQPADTGAQEKRRFDEEPAK